MVLVRIINRKDKIMNCTRMNEYDRRSQKIWQIVFYRNLQKIYRVTTRIGAKKIVKITTIG